MCAAKAASCSSDFFSLFMAYRKPCRKATRESSSSSGSAKSMVVMMRECTVSAPFVGGDEHHALERGAEVENMASYTPSVIQDSRMSIHMLSGLYSSSFQPVPVISM